MYEAFEYQPIWINGSGLSADGEEFMEILQRDIAADGLDKDNYHYAPLQQQLDKLEQDGGASALVELELIMSEAFVRLAHDLHYGRVDPSDRSSKWKMEPKSSDVNEEEALASVGKGKASSIRELLEDLRPQNTLYDGLRSALESLLNEKSDFGDTPIHYDGALEVSDRAEVILQVRRVLEAMGEQGLSQAEQPQVYDEDLANAVKRFQKRHGLKEDGVLGEDFWRAINYSKEDLMVKLKVNLERLRWLPDFLSQEGPKVLVNIPNYYMDYVVDQDTVFSTRAVVGKEYYQTPVFAAKMNYLVFSPYWNLPEGILWAETIPAILKDKNYLSAHHMEVVDKEGQRIDPSNISWKKLKKEEGFPYLIRQRPGDRKSVV